jgi:hypothetical protein
MDDGKTFIYRMEIHINSEDRSHFSYESSAFGNESFRENGFHGVHRDFVSFFLASHK